jgi:tetratricopeptide (TPR) repeat protein
MSNGDQEKFVEFFTTVMVGSKFIERNPDDLAKCWHPDLIQCMEIAQEKEKVHELRSALEHKLAALNLSEEGKYTEAINEYRKAVDVFPYSLHFNFILALGYIDTKEYNEASKLLEDILLVKPNDWEAKYYLSRCCYILKDVDRAITLLEDCIKTNYEPNMSLEIGTYYYSKGKSIGQELYRKLGIYDQQRTAEMASPYLEKAINSFQLYSKSGGEVDPQYFNTVCNLFDQLSPGRLQYMGIPLSLNRLYGVLSNVDEVPGPVLDAKFHPEKKVCSAFVFKVNSFRSGRTLTNVSLYETADTDDIRNGIAEPLYLVEIVFPGQFDNTVPDVTLTSCQKPEI